VKTTQTGKAVRSNTVTICTTDRSVVHPELKKKRTRSSVTAEIARDVDDVDFSVDDVHRALTLVFNSVHRLITNRRY